jgi:hypothetical protein
MRRRLIQLLCCLCACVAIATAAIWVHSLFSHATLAFVRVDRQGAHPVARMRNLEWYAGNLCIYWLDATILDPRPYEIYIRKEGRGWSVDFTTGPRDDPDHEAYLAGFGTPILGGQFYHRFHNQPEMTGPQMIIWIPCWWVLLVSVPLPALVLFRRVRARRRVQQGRCVACGYDLRASPDRCPECGAVPEKPAHNPPMRRPATAGTGAVE